MRPRIPVNIVGNPVPARPEIDQGLLQALLGGGIPAPLLAEEKAAEVRLWLAQEGWESLNLAALVACARGERRTEFLVEREPGVPVAQAMAGPDEPRTRRLLRPGWRVKSILLDRDGTLIEDRNYLRDPEAVRLLQGAEEGLRRLTGSGIAVVVLTNQSGVARGLISADDLQAVHARLEELLARRGIALAGILVCPHGSEDGCHCRKPAPGLAEQAAERFGIDLGRALVVGDSRSDLELGRCLALPTVLVATGNGPETLEDGGPRPDYLVGDLAELARLATHPAGLLFDRSPLT